jgi:hypothetical protein
LTRQLSVKAEKLIEACEHCNSVGAEIPFDWILDRVFTIHECPKIPLDKFFRSHRKPTECDIDKLEEWIVRGKDKPRLLAELHRIGVSCRTVSPDLDGLATGIWQTECLRQVVGK